MSAEWETLVASPRDREHLVVEIYHGADQWAELSNEGDTPTLEIYPHPGGGAWVFNLVDAMHVLQRAAESLRSLKEPPRKSAV